MSYIHRYFQRLIIKTFPYYGHPEFPTILSLQEVLLLPVNLVLMEDQPGAMWPFLKIMPTVPGTMLMAE